MPLILCQENKGVSCLQLGRLSDSQFRDRTRKHLKSRKD